MTRRTLLAVAAAGTFLAMGACSKKGSEYGDSTGAAMADTATSGTTTGTMQTPPPAPTMSDTTAAGTAGTGTTGTYTDTTKGRASGDTTTKK
jgi:hypothetical protein